MKTTKLILNCTIVGFFLISCTNNNRNGSNMTEEGTVQTNNVNSEMEDNRTAADVDTIVSPGSNAVENKNRDGAASGNSSANVDNSNTSASQSPGTGKDPNMAGQSSTHGKETTAGDK